MHDYAYFMHKNAYFMHKNAYFMHDCAYFMHKMHILCIKMHKICKNTHVSSENAIFAKKVPQKEINASTGRTNNAFYDQKMRFLNYKILETNFSSKNGIFRKNARDPVAQKLLEN